MGLLPKDPAAQKRVLIGVIPILLALAYYQFVYSPRSVEIEAERTRLETLVSQNAAAEAAVARYGPNLRQQLEIYEAHLATIETLVPRRNDIPNLLVAMGEQALEHRVQWGGFVPKAEEAGEHYSKQTYEINVSGMYHDIGSYLAAVGSLPRIVKPGAVYLNLTQARAGRDPSLPPLLRARFDVETYVLPSPGETLPPTPATTPRSPQ
jgi:type IV pilus assembly protein PilO